MKRFFLILTTLLSTPLFAAETCYQLTAQAEIWSRTPESLCVGTLNSDGQADLKLVTGAFNPRVLATFTLDLISRVKCLDCNEDVYGVAIPSNSVFNNLQVRFSGIRDIKSGQESGTVSIGDTKFHYRKR